MTVSHRGQAVTACQISKSQMVRTATWNVSSMVRRSGEVVEALHRIKIDLCAQEMRWKGERAKMLRGIADKEIWMT